MEGVAHFVDPLARELVLFEAAMLLIGGIDDLAVDLLYWWRRIRRGPDVPFKLSPRRVAGRMAVFVPAWHEADVIGRMLDAALIRYQHPDYRIFVGCYPNDPDTIDAVAAVAEYDARVRLVINSAVGPTTKADNLNAVWHALLRDDAADGQSTRAVVLHDAEDVVHADELDLFDALIDVADVVQIPVVPLIDPASRWIGGHYADEFAEAHGRHMLVRTALGAGMPLAGTGCAIATPMLAQIAHARGGDPFDAASLTEDYELGLRIAELGGHGSFVRVTDDRGRIVAVRAFFPGTLAAAVRQKARWMTGIALAGWDRTGWGPARALSDHWMRMRDRRAPLAMLVLAIAYIALLSWGASLLLHKLSGTQAPATIPTWLFVTNTALLAWRLAMRATATAKVHGRLEGLLAIPRFLVGNLVALIAARRAMRMYMGMLAGQPPRWDKTRHHFPDLASVPQ
ncbi:glycosyl transferase family protein [Sphingomonas aerophila]|uniref:Adsorption protein B n=1 Tax=Sphingomonas aerophila TaxID=1344948 RepID=A0A7W9BA90_9SPHN|nr:adsorption protein B [Sphingomonas aerophila]